MKNREAQHLAKVQSGDKKLDGIESRMRKMLYFQSKTFVLM